MHSPHISSRSIFYSIFPFGLPSGLFPSVPPPRPCTPSLRSPHVPRAKPILIDMIYLNNIWLEVQIIKLSFVVFMFHITLSFLGPNNFLGTLFLYTLSLCSSLNAQDRVTTPKQSKHNYSSVNSNLYIFK